MTLDLKPILERAELVRDEGVLDHAQKNLDLINIDIPAMAAEITRLTAVEADLRERVERMGQAILDVADTAQDEGDRAYFCSTNDLDRLRQIRDEYFEWRFLSAKELAKANAVLNLKESPTS